jgi:translation initiation factor IF-2
MVGEKFMVVGAEDNVGAIIEEHKQKHLELMSNLKLEPTGQPKIMNIIIKTSAQGCVDALISVLKGIKSDRVGLKLLKCDVGDINQSDIKQAETAAARVFGFGVKAGRDALNYADQKRITVKTFEIIYEFVEGVRQAMVELLNPEIIRNEVGQINILAIFKTDKTRMVVGGKISSGKLKKGLKVDVLRNGVSVGAGKIVGLQKQKEAQDEIAMGNEAGVLFEGSVVVEVKDTLMAFEEEKKYPEL